MLQNLVQAAGSFRVCPDGEQDHFGLYSLRLEEAIGLAWRLALSAIGQRSQDGASSSNDLLPRYHECDPILGAGKAITLAVALAK